jgi:hypothetical protein
MRQLLFLLPLLVAAVCCRAVDNDELGAGASGQTNTASQQTSDSAKNAWLNATTEPASVKDRNWASGSSSVNTAPSVVQPQLKLDTLPFELTDT